MTIDIRLIDCKNQIRYLFINNCDITYTRKYLQRRFQISSSDVRVIINMLRTSGLPIVSKRPGGYYLTNNTDDIKNQIKGLENRISCMNSAVNGLKKSLKNLPEELDLKNQYINRQEW